MIQCKGEKMKHSLLTAVFASGLLMGCSSSEMDSLAVEQEKQAKELSELKEDVSILRKEIQLTKKQSVNTVDVVNQLNANQQKLIVQAQADQVSDTYTVKEQDTLYRIAKAHDTTVDALLKLNPHVNSPEKLLIGEKLSLK